MATIGNLVVEMQANSAAFASDMRKARAAVDSNTASMNRALAKAERGIISVRAAAARYAAVLVTTYVTTQTIGGLVRTAAAYEQLRLQLETVTGSMYAAEGAFGLILDFAKTTPFEVDKITEAFIRMKAVGIEPTRELLTSFGNTAAAFGKDITDFSDAVIAATTGEAERLKAFGIVARMEGDKVRFIFDGMEQTVARDADAIVAHLKKIGDERFAGGMERQTNSLAGAFSNLQDSASSLADAIGQFGLTWTLTKASQAAGWFFEQMAQGIHLLRQDAGVLSLTEEIEQTERRLAELGREMDYLQEKSVDPELSADKQDRALQKLLETTRAFNKELARRAELEARKGASLKIKVTDPSDIEVSTAAIKEYADSLARAVDYAQEMAEAEGATIMLEQAEAARKAADAQAEVARIVEETRTPMEAYALTVERLNGLVDQGALDWDTYARAVKKAQDDLKKATDETKNAEDAARQLGLTFSSAFEDAIVAGNKLSDVIQGLAQDIARIAIRKAVTEPLAGFFGDFFKGVLGFAGGGRPPVGVPSLVGERGPELFVPDRGGTIVPNHALGRMGGGGTVVNIIDNRSGGEPVTASQRRGGDGREMLDVVINDSNTRQLSNGRLDEPMRSRYGVRPRPRAV